MGNRTKAWQEFKARYQAAPLYWGPRSEVWCEAHRRDGAQKIRASYAYNYSKRCEECSRHG